MTPSSYRNYNSYGYPAGETIPVTIMAHTSVAVDVEMSTPSTKPLTIEQKADLYEADTQFGQVLPAKMSMTITSPNSGNTYLISYDAAACTWRCSCKADKPCWHLCLFTRCLEYFVKCGSLILPWRAPAASSARLDAIIDRGFGSHEAYLEQRRKDFGA